MIEVRDVSYVYPNGTAALEGVSLEFPRGTISSVLGESGSGKTTLLMCLGRFQEPTSGAITIDDRPLAEIPETEFRSTVGIVFQELYLFPHLTVLENMTLARIHAMGAEKSEAEEEAARMLERLGIGHIAESYPAHISGGQAQRAAIARGLLLKPDYMLLDEPTSALDANTTDDFAAWLREIREETNFIIVTHDVLFARKVASRGVYLSGGKVLDAGDVDKIIEHVRAGGLVEASE